MKRFHIIIAIVAGVILSSCSKKVPDFVDSIPDNAIGVLTLHPMKLHTKSRVNSIESIKERVRDEVWSMVLEDPLSTGLMMDEYFYVFVTMEEEGPVIGVVGGMKDEDKFVSVLNRIKDDIGQEFVETASYTYVQPDEEGIIAWDDEQLIVLTSPGEGEFETEYYTATLDRMFDPVKEESITSLVDFKDFLGKMEDLNLWFATDKMGEIAERIAGDRIPELPVNLLNNYGQVFVDFANGVVNVKGETHFSEEVEKNVEEFLVLNPSLNDEMLGLAPGGDLLLALAGSMDIEKLASLVQKFAPPEIDTVGNRVEAFTGVPAGELLNALTGDFTLAVNALESQAMIPLEVFIGFGVNGTLLQEKLKEKVRGVAPVEEEGDFFIINIQGTEIYSGILNDLWVVTNAKGYRDAVGSGKLEHSLMDSRFSDFADGSMGFYLNLNLEAYPSLVQGILDQNEQQKRWIERITDPFDYLGISGGNYESQVVLKTSSPSENSLYTILKMTDTAE